MAVTRNRAAEWAVILFGFAVAGVAGQAGYVRMERIEQAQQCTAEAVEKIQCLIADQDRTDTQKTAAISAIVDACRVNQQTMTANN